jgi:hypothetical protein
VTKTTTGMKYTETYTTEALLTLAVLSNADI